MVGKGRTMIFRKRKVGKRIFKAIYIHEDYIQELPIGDRALIREAEYIKDKSEGSSPWNIVKINKNAVTSVSFLFYSHFDIDPHPEVISSVVVRNNEASKRIVKSGSILHRKELLVGDDHPNRDMWVQLTKDEEDAGLLSKEHKCRIGRKTYWEALLIEKKLQISDHQLQLWGGVPYRTYMKSRTAFGG